MENSQNNSVAAEQHRSKRILLGGLVCLCALAVVFFATTTFLSRRSPQPEIQSLLEKRAAALSQKDLERYLSCFSSQYQDGEQGYTELKDNASRWFEQFESIHFSFQTLRLDIKKTQALVENNYTFSLRPPDGDLLNISNKEMLELRRESGGWKIFKNIKPTS